MVEITVDTKRDSPEEIRKIVKYLQDVIGESTLATAYSEQASESVPSSDVFGMFDQTPASSEATQEEEGEESPEEVSVEIVEY